MMYKLVITLSIVAICVGFTMAGLSIEAFSPYRTFLVEEKISFKNLAKDAHNIQIWIPRPVKDKWQVVEDFKLSGPFDISTITDREYENKIIYINARPVGLKEDAALQIMLSFKVRRKEYGISNTDSSFGKNIKRFLKPDRLVPVDGKIRTLARHITQGKPGDIEKARAVYDYIIDEITYSKDDPNVCGVGDSLLTLEHKKGICTDYHSLFISLVRSLGIPAKFEIGFRIPADKEQGMLNGYHCWAKFYINGIGWIPVDISEADKNPRKRDYFFGHIDENRIHLTTGRDIRLKNAQDSQPLNFFIYPYAEVNGSIFKDIDIEISFKEVRGGGPREKDYNL